MNSENGFTLPEALLSTVLLLIVSFESINLFYKVIELQKQGQKHLGLITSRNRILSLVVDEKGWSEIVKDSANVEMSCWLNQNDFNATNRDCYNKEQSLKLKYLNGEEAYNSQIAQNGLSYNGENCNDFKDEPEVINKQCPVRLEMKWKSVCEASPCENPLMKVEGNLKYRSDDRVIPNLKLFQFKYYRSKVFCPLQAESTNIDLVNNGVLITPTTVVSTATGINPNTGKARNNVELYPCQWVSIKFNEEVVTSQASLPPPLLISDANNTSVLCLANASGSCEFIWRRTGLDYHLYHNATLVAQKPAFLSLSASVELEFQVVNGLVRFCTDGSCHMFYDQKLVGPFRVHFEPSNSDYSGGFSNISIKTNKSLNYFN